MISTLTVWRRRRRRPDAAEIVRSGHAMAAGLLAAATADTIMLPAARTDPDDIPLMGRSRWRPAAYAPRHHNGRIMTW